MDRIYRNVKNLQVLKADSITQKRLEANGLHGIVLRSYQLDGVSWICNRHGCSHGCILGDEMGLGKTIQVISVLLDLKVSKRVPGPFLILSPLSVLNNWKNEFERFTRKLKVKVLSGSKEEREIVKNSLENSNKMQDSNKENTFDVLLTSYEVCLRETAFLCKFHWSVLAVDEAHRLKNSNSLLYQELLQFQVDFSILLTGTPVQNNLKELYALLSFVDPSIFPLGLQDDFVEAFGSITSQLSGTCSQLQQLLSPFLLRRVKSEVMLDLPGKSEVILYAGMSELQKKYYKALLTKDLGLFSHEGATRNRLNNILVNLRKCVNHPYLFDGVEPEPFQLGEHLVTSSGKLHAIDQLLSYLQSRGHKVLMFSQMTRMLDIIQDYCGYRGFTYERLDGSVRGEERYIAIKNFNEVQDTFLFLLSTRAGGQGLNLMSADTVIFVDSDYNPQNDLQAAARAHRLGQTRPVKIIRLVCRNTVEEIILKRADEKLKLTNNVIEGGQFSGSGVNQVAETNLQLADILKFGLEKLFESEDSAITEKEFERILGQSRDGEWVEDTAQEQQEDEAMGVDTDLKASTMYVYEGRDYSKGASTQDVAAFDNMVAEIMEEVQNTERSLRSVNRAPPTLLPDLTTRKRKVLTADEIEQNRIKRKEAAAKRARLKEEEVERKEQERKKRLAKLWRDNDYISRCIVREESDDEEESGSEDDAMTSSDEDQTKRLDIQYVRGDVTHPINTCGRDAIIVHCVDDSGYWGSGGLFTAIARRSTKPQEAYELAGDMKDLNLGDTHLIPIDDSQDGIDSLALIVAQTRDKQNRLTPIDLSALSDGLLCVAQEAKRNKASVHLPRIGHSTPGFNWYGTERLIRKHLAARGVPTSIYYFPRKGMSSTSTTTTTTRDDADDVKTKAESTANTSSSTGGKSVDKTREQRPNSGSGPGGSTMHQTKAESTANTSSSTGGKSVDKTRKQRLISGGSCPGSGPGGSTMHPLPAFLTGVTVYFHEVEEETERRLTRYVIAFNGDVERSISSDVSHVICANTDGVSRGDDKFPDNAKVVSPLWLEKCCKKRKLLNTAHYQL